MSPGERGRELIEPVQAQRAAMWAEASRSIWIPGVPEMELLDLHVCPDGFQSVFAPLTSFYVPFLSV